MLFTTPPQRGNNDNNNNTNNVTNNTNTNKTHANFNNDIDNHNDNTTNTEPFDEDPGCKHVDKPSRKHDFESPFVGLPSGIVR